MDIVEYMVRLKAYCKSFPPDGCYDSDGVLCKFFHYTDSGRCVFSDLTGHIPQEWDDISVERRLR